MGIASFHSANPAQCNVASPEAAPISSETDPCDFYSLYDITYPYNRLGAPGALGSKVLFIVRLTVYLAFQLYETHINKLRVTLSAGEVIGTPALVQSHDERASAKPSKGIIDEILYRKPTNWDRIVSSIVQ